MDIEALVGQTEGYVGADIEALVREAKMAAVRDFLAIMGTKTEQERTDAIKNVMITKTHFDAAMEKVKGSLDRDAIEKSERQAWGMLYNTDERNILDRATTAIRSAEMLAKEGASAAIDELRKAVYVSKKDMTAIKKLTESLEEKMASKMG